jgi:glycosyltransferase involved in cell wall biosynthesis
MRDAPLSLAPAGSGAPARARVPRILTTLNWWRRPAWMSRVEVLDREKMSTRALLARLVASAPDYDVLVLDGATGGAVRATDLGAAALLARRRSGPKVVLTDATWARGRGLTDRLACRAGLAAIDSERVVYCVLSSDEARRFPATWGVPADRVVFTPFYFTASDEDLAAPVSEDGGVFAGGDSVRDYRPLLAAAAHLDARVTIATRVLGAARGLPPNVVAGPVTHPEFMAGLRAASVVVVALARTGDRSAGQQTYLNAMAMGKLVVVPDVLGVRDYVEHGRTGLIVPAGNAAALEDALRWALHPAHRAAAAAIAAQARATVRERFGPDAYAARVLAVADAAAGYRAAEAVEARREGAGLAG